MLRSYFYLFVILTTTSGLGWWSQRVEGMMPVHSGLTSRDLAHAGGGASRISLLDISQIQLYSLDSRPSARRPATRVGENPPSSERLLEIEEISPIAVPRLNSTDKPQEVFDTKISSSVD